MSVDKHNKDVNVMVEPRKIKRYETKKNFTGPKVNPKAGLFELFHTCSLEVIQFLEPFFVCLSLLAKPDFCPYYS